MFRLLSRTVLVRRVHQALPFQLIHPSSCDGPLIRAYGEAPSRVRPVEVVREHAWRQGEQEVSATLLIAFMFAVPLWLILLSQAENGAEKEMELQRLKVIAKVAEHEVNR